MSIFRKIWDIISTVVVIVVILLAIALVGVKAIGITPYAVLSGSMEPTYHVGSVIYVKQTEPSSVQVGDPITFYFGDSNTVATHRVIDIDNENRLFYTQGDANDDPDQSPTEFGKLIGIPVFSIPLLGRVAAYFQSAMGPYLLLVLVGIVIVIMILPTYFFKEKENDGGVESSNN